MITLTVPSAFTGNLSRSGAAFGPYLPFPGAANAAVAKTSSIAATRCKRQRRPTAPFVFVCGFIRVLFLKLPANFVKLWGGSLSLAPRPSNPARVIAKPCLGAPNCGGNRAKQVLYLRGGKVEPSHHSHQAEREDDGFAALGHSGDLTSPSYNARRHPELWK